jgi:hypothetical protein
VDSRVDSMLVWHLRGPDSEKAGVIVEISIVVSPARQVGGNLLLFDSIPCACSRS